MSHTFSAFCEKTGLPPEGLLTAVAEVTASYGTDDVMLPLDTPLVTEEEWIRQVADALAAILGRSVPMVSLADTWFDGRETNRQWADELRRTRDRGVFVGLLTNMPPAWDAHWRRMVPPEGLFAEVVSSAEVGCRKPDPEIYALAAARAGVRPEECVLVDDLEKNCAGAERAGWRAVRFTDTAVAIQELTDLLAGRPASGATNRAADGITNRAADGAEAGTAGAPAPAA
ncbi:HAD family phosphatase [Spongiactinospora sp. TRM90649]|nr:HAD family phosphatase [Spongiactinospora sp. TRM90649]MDF5752449.1 HAD family phosphatase [Spongiactinospora sp. TRM90649]